MYYIFGYTKEVPVKIERDTSRIILLGIAVLVVLLFVFLSFEDIDGETLGSYLSFHAPSGSAQIVNVDNELEVGWEQHFWRSELKKLSRYWWDAQSQ
jgi:hypothetical protein